MSELVYSPGLEGVVAGETAISTIAGGLQYRGYAIEDLAEQSTFEEVAWLLLRGELPTSDQLAGLRGRLADATVPHEIIDTLRAIPSDASMMDVLRTGASLLAHWDPDSDDNSEEAELRKAERLLAQLPVIMAAKFRLNQAMEPVGPDAKRSLAENILWMCFRKDDAQAARALDTSLVLYAEHEYNASAFTSRVIASTLSDLHSAVVGAIGALKGPLHGGANERVMAVLDEVGSPDNAEPWIRNALDNKRRIMGFGHRVYKQGDPRAEYLKKSCAALATTPEHKAMEETAEVIEQIVRDEKGLPPNLDWPSARLYHYLGLPVELYTPLFVLSRIAGWSAHVIEQHSANRLIRPRARYTGPEPREWVPLDAR